MIKTVGSEITIKNSSLKTLKELVIKNQKWFPWVNVLHVEASRMPHQVLKALKMHVICDPEAPALVGELVDDLKEGDEVDFQNRMVLLAPVVEDGSWVNAVMNDRLYRFVFESGKVRCQLVTLEGATPKFSWKDIGEIDEFADDYEGIY